MKMMSRKLAMPLLGVLLWVISIHAGTFATATLLPRPVTGLASPTRDDNILSMKFRHVKIAAKDLNNSISYGHNVINHMLRLETNLQWSNVHVQKGTPSHGFLIVSYPEEEALKQGREALVASKASAELMDHFCRRYYSDTKDCAKHMTAYSFASTSLEGLCQKIQNKKCTQEEILSQYRAVDGTCNHQNNGSIGSSFTAYQRLLYPAYDDGIQIPRQFASRKRLPSARLVSGSLLQKIGESDSDTTLAMVQWSQFVEHDLSHTATSKMVHSDHTIECCASSGRNLSPRYIHPFCSHISVPYDDHYYSKYGLDCMTYVRSVPAFRPGCTFGPLEQMNQATHYLDGSQIYSSTRRKIAGLRSFRNGELLVSKKDNRNFLPVSQKPEDDCQVNKADVCFISGDSRVNMHPQLTTMHTLWMREHNRVARELAKLNPSWDDETLFQEARRVVIAEMQHITYDHWLPQILGKKFYNKVQKYKEYDEKADPSVSNSFATASMRVLNSLIDGNLKLYKENRAVNATLALHNHFNKPTVIEQPSYLDALIRGLATQSSQKMDLRYSEDLSHQLFSHGDFGYDIFSLDIQRGRDHGLATYNSYRTLCGLPDAKTFDDLIEVMSPEVVKALSELYHSPRDVDLIVGGIAELPSGDSLFGPTFSCLVADQFLRTRRGDRYFYTNEHQPAPLSSAQIREIDKVTLARVFCDNGDTIEKMQLNVFKKISERNDLKSCDEIPGMDLKMWKDSREKYY